MKKLVQSDELRIPYNLSQFSFYYIFDNNGSLAYVREENGANDSELLDAGIAIDAGRNPVVMEVGNGSDKYYMMVKRTIVVSGKTLGQYVVGRDVTLAFEAMDRLLGIMAYSILVGAMISFLLGYFIAGKTIKPIQQAYKSKERFVADASHELRTPVSVIMLSADSLERELDERQSYARQVTRDIKESAKKMGNLVENLLFLARSDQHVLVIDKKRMNLSRCLEVSAENFLKIAEANHITIRTDIQDGLMINGDEQLLETMASIFIDNAIKHTGEGGNVKVSAAKAGIGKVEAVTVMIEDNGIGIAKSELGKIFERFYRPDVSRNSSTGGYGLGLSIAKEIIDQHKGRVEVDSEQGKGTKFTIILPV